MNNNSSVTAPNAKSLEETSICFLCHPTLNLSDMDSMAETILKILTIASK